MMEQIMNYVKTGTDCCSSGTVFYWNWTETVSDSKG